MTDRKPTPKPRPVEPAARGCNLPGCPYDATTRGLCDAHWSTHRGLADPILEEETDA